MTIIKCDRCGKELKYRPDIVKIQLEGYHGDISRYDLCSSCVESLKIWLHSEADT